MLPKSQYNQKENDTKLLRFFANETNGTKSGRSPRHTGT